MTKNQRVRPGGSWKKLGVLTVGLEAWCREQVSRKPGPVLQARAFVTGGFGGKVFPRCRGKA